MGKNGFTLVELLAVIVLIAVVSVIGSYGVSGINKAIKTNLWESKKELIVSSAIKLGEDHVRRLTGTCSNINLETNIEYEIPNCLEVNVQYLLDKLYITSKDRDEDDNKIIINDLTEEVVNDMPVLIYVENDIVYAEIKNTV